MTKADEYRKRIADLEKGKRDADKLRQEAIAELLAQRRDINRELRALGYEPEADTHEVQRPAPKSEPAGGILDLLEHKPRRRISGRHCGVCNVDGHDGRAHRGQSPKRPFTDAELAELGLHGRGGVG
jgi:hypothetical protein